VTVRDSVPPSTTPIVSDRAEVSITGIEKRPVVTYGSVQPVAVTTPSTLTTNSVAPPPVVRIQ
jgi:hypothetical protein